MILCYNYDISYTLGGAFMKNTLGSHLRNLRLEHDLTQQQLAENLSLDRSTVAYMESGRILPNLRTLAKLKSLYRLSWDELLNGI